MNKLFFFALCLFSLPCLAQEASDDVPDGNPVQFPKGAAQWTVDVVYPAATTPAPASSSSPRAGASGSLSHSGRLKKIDVIHSDDLELMTITWGGGTKTEQWFVVASQALITTDTTSGTPAFFSKNSFLMQASFRTGFESVAFQWLKKDYFINKIPYQNRTCLHYKATLNLGRDRQMAVGGAHYPTNTFEAWVDKDTHQPVAFYDGIKTGVYTFAKDPPSEPLKMSPAIEDVYKANTIPLIPPKS